MCGAVALVHRPGKRTPIGSGPDRKLSLPTATARSMPQPRGATVRCQPPPARPGSLPVASGASNRPTCVGCGGISSWYWRGVDYSGAGPPEEGGAIVDEQDGGSFLADMTDIEFAKYQQLIWQAETPKKLKQAKL